MLCFLLVMALSRKLKSMRPLIFHICYPTVKYTLFSSSKNLWQTSRGVKTIQDVTNATRKMVGANLSFSDENHDRSSLVQYLVDDQNKLPFRHMKDSFQNAVIPLSDKAVREKYLNDYDSVRYGQLLENLDIFAVLIGYEHNKPMLSETGKSPLSIVTAMVDEIKIMKNIIDPTVDIHMTGHVTWAGRSSLEISMWLKQNEEPILEAQFVIVARDPENKKAAVVFPLVPENDEDEKLMADGRARKSKRLLESRESLLETPPTPAEQQLIHELFMHTLDTSSKSFRSRVVPSDSVWMEMTKLKNAIICFPEQRNIHNKVFGGFIMRKAYELAWANARVFSNSEPSVAFMDDIFFHCPVPIGSLLLMSSQISYVERQHFMTRVNAEVMDTLTGNTQTSNIFYFAFTCSRRVPTVTPRTYGESMLYLDCMRRFKGKQLEENIST